MYAVNSSLSLFKLLVWSKLSYIMWTCILSRSNGLKLKHINYGAFLINRWASDVELNLYESVLRTKQTHLHHFQQMFISGWTIPLIKTYCSSKEACQWRTKKPEAKRLKPIRDESPETLHCSCYCQWSQVAVRSNRAPRRGLYKVEISLVLLQLAHISLSLCWAI